MKDQILKGYVDDFAKAFELEDIEDSIVFEHFANFCVTSKQYPREFDFDILHVGGSDDIGLDGAAFIAEMRDRPRFPRRYNLGLGKRERATNKLHCAREIPWMGSSSARRA
jgi:hypothetical protein